jgi:hypothetical protein
MEEENKIETIDDLYYALSRIYSCKYADKEEDIDKAKVQLYHAVKTNGYSVDHLLRKMRQLKAKLRLAGDFESKLATQIMNRYWEKDFSDQMIPYRPFRGE